MKHYSIYNITDNNEFALTRPLEDFRQFIFTNTDNGNNSVTFDLYLKDPYKNPNTLPQQETYYLLRNKTIEFGASLTLGSDEIPYLKENVRKVYIKSHDTQGQLTVTVK